MGVLKRFLKESLVNFLYESGETSGGFIGRLLGELSEGIVGGTTGTNPGEIPV